MTSEYAKEQFRCLIEIRSPVHIGCDEVFEPTGFALDDRAGQIVAFDPFELIAGLMPEERERLSGLCRSGSLGSILGIYKFFMGRTAKGRRIDVCADFPAHFRKTLSIRATDESRIRQELNRFQIARTCYLPGDQRPIIPGSSVKGALRTAYLNGRARGIGKDLQRVNKADELEKRLLEYSQIPEDPFRLVKVSDFRPVGEVRTRIVYAVNEKKTPSDKPARGPFQIFEIIEPGAAFEGTISVEKPLRGAKIRQPVTMEALLGSCRNFYQKELQREQKVLSAIGAAAADLSEEADMTTFPLRVGRHSGAESVTIEGHRRIKILGKRGERPRNLDRATTVWLASESRKPTEKIGLRPFGWVRLIELHAHQVPALEEIEQRYLKSAQPEEKQEASLASSIPAEVGNEDQAEAVPPQGEQRQQEEIWEDVTLSYTPNNGVITASREGKKATTSSRDLVPENLQEKLFGRKKCAQAKRVTVEPLGNSFQIVDID